ncbi:hypothetical protein FGG08_003689 [Glutinoglossum americanum]|uniref:Uncharacterized protein n=1 Tax=Glutinoglossum americanum TaxID=1670608 RepID=A0A9P8KXV2_9PEZI|nr:hypothetical protein FGG08_003689 [Glutinoglossum americanum]
MKRQALDSDPLRGLRHDFKGARIDDNHEISMSMSMSSTQPLNLMPTTLSPSVRDVSGAQEHLNLGVQHHQQLYHQAYSQAPIQPSLLTNGHDGLSNNRAVTNGLASQMAREQQQQQNQLDMIDDPSMVQEYLDGFPSPALFNNLLNEYV